MGCSTYLGLGWRYQPLAPGHPTSICDIGVKFGHRCPVYVKEHRQGRCCYLLLNSKDNIFNNRTPESFSPWTISCRELSLGAQSVKSTDIYIKLK